MLSKAQKDQVRRDHISARASGRLPGSYELEFIPEAKQPKTACWRWSSDLKKHVIQINEGVDRLMDRTIADRRITPFDLDVGVSVPYGGNYAISNKRHEDAHSLWTDHNFRKIREVVEKLCKKAKVPPPTFSKFNLFEDARIEDLYRRNFKLRFNWLNYEFSYLERTGMMREVRIPEGELWLDTSGKVPEYRVAEEDTTREVPAAEPVNLIAADGIFHALIQMEKSGEEISKLRDACAEAATCGEDPSNGPYKNRYTKGEFANAAHLFERILWYYRRACRAKDTVELVKLMVKYYIEFLTESDRTGKGDGPGSGPRSGFKPGKGDKHGTDWDEAIAEAEERGEGSTGEAEETPAEPEDKDYGEGDDEDDDEEEHAPPVATTAGGVIDSGGSLSCDSAETFYDSDPKIPGTATPNPALAEKIKELLPRDSYGECGIFSKTNINPLIKWDRVQKMVPLLDRALRGGIRKETTMSPRRRMNIRGLLRGSPRIFKGKTRSPLGPKKVVMLYDCSGSMRGHPHNEGLIILGALNELHRRNRVEATVILTWGPCFKMPMPFDPGLLFHLNAPGGTEGFAAALRKHDNLVREADVVFVYTDAMITDEPIDLSYWRARNIDSIGLYCGGGRSSGEGLTEKTKYMKSYFTKSLIRMTAEELLDALIKVIKKW